MKALEFEEVNAVYGANQPAYLPLPGYKQSCGLISFLFEANEQDVSKIVDSQTIAVQRLVFNGSPQSTLIFTEKPAFPITLSDFFTRCANRKPARILSDDLVEYTQVLSAIDLVHFMQTKHFWVVTYTGLSPLQPIRLQL